MKIYKRNELPIEIGKKLSAEIINIDKSKWLLRIKDQEFWLNAIKAVDGVIGTTFNICYTEKHELLANVADLTETLNIKIQRYTDQEIWKAVDEGIRDKEAELERTYKDKMDAIIGKDRGKVTVRLYKDIEDTYYDARVEYLEDGRIKIISPNDEALYEKEKFISVKIKKGKGGEGFRIF